MKPVSPMLRARLPAGVRRAVRWVTDPLSGPLGSIRGARTGERVIALTFDDGPDPSSTSGVLDVLSRRGVSATFFVLVDRAEAHPELIARLLADGHEVGLHGVDHTRLTHLPPAKVGDHIAEGARRLARVTGAKPRWFRPPYGAQTLRSFLCARRIGMEVVVWSTDCEDWAERSEADIAEKATAAATPGGVILLHDSLAANPGESPPQVAIDRAKVAELLLDGLARRGYRPVSMTRLLQQGKAHRTAWFRP